jgi:hypothetical protein
LAMTIDRLMPVWAIVAKLPPWPPCSEEMFFES